MTTFHSMKDSTAYWLQEIAVNLIMIFKAWSFSLRCPFFSCVTIQWAKNYHHHSNLHCEHRIFMIIWPSSLPVSSGLKLSLLPCTEAIPFSPNKLLRKVDLARGSQPSHTEWSTPHHQPSRQRGATKLSISHAESNNPTSSRSPRERI